MALIPTAGGAAADDLVAEEQAGRQEPEGSPATEDDQGQGEKAAAGGHDLVEAAHRTEGEVAASKPGHRCAKQHG